jgi:tetratricopeptide (TPR) repeat protein
MMKGDSMKKTTPYLVLTAALILSLGAVSAAYASEAAVADIDKGWQTMDIPLLEKTVPVFEEMATKDPKDAMAPYYAAKAHFAIADIYDIKSEKEFDQTGEGDKHLDAAIELIRTAVTLKEDSLDAQVLKFQILRRKMLHVSFPRLMMYVGERRGTYDKVKALAPDSATFYLINGIETGEAAHPAPPPEKPIAEFEKALQKDPKMAEAYYQIGVVWDTAKKVDEAKKNYEKTLELEPNHHWATKKLKGLASASGA